mmetsp:Transcript_12924/g.26204  ORF Transcript_12924/g.26204 Transcript_12924/m.26204 type:complete len:88 (+) Transcript_12924:31-294(+)
MRISLLHPWLSRHHQPSTNFDPCAIDEESDPATGMSPTLDPAEASTSSYRRLLLAVDLKNRVDVSKGFKNVLALFGSSEYNFPRNEN